MSKPCYLCGDKNVYKPVEENHPNTIACRPCYIQKKIQEYRIKEAKKPPSERRKCCVCGQYLTSYDDRFIDDDTGLRYHDYCKQQFELVYKYKPKTCNYCHKTFTEVLKYKVDKNDRNTYACENCYDKEKIKQGRVLEAQKPISEQRKCCVCGEFLTNYDERWIDDNTGLRYHESCKSHPRKIQRTKNPYIILF